MTTVIAIDGPAGAGKSTVARAVAVRLGLPHVDTGAFYRALTLAALRAGVDPSDQAALLDVLERVGLHVSAGRVWLDDDDVTAEIRTDEVAALVSTVARHPRVRAALVRLQRAAVGEHGGVVEGRDAATVIVPDATLKVWLTAPPAIRAARRAAQQGHADAVTVDHVATQLLARDHADRDNTHRAADAIEIDTSQLSVAHVVDRVAALVADHG